METSVNVRIKRTVEEVLLANGYLSEIQSNNIILVGLKNIKAKLIIIEEDKKLYFQLDVLPLNEIYEDVNIYKELLLKYNVGTSYPVIKDDDVLNLVIPIIDISIQNRIEEKIKKSFLLKEESKRLLDLAKKAVEIAIEKDENEAVEFINEQI